MKRSPIASNIERLLKARNETINAAAVASGINFSTLSRILSGDIQRPRKKTLRLLAEHFNVTLISIERDSDEPANAALFAQSKTTLSKADQIQAIYDRLSRIQDDLIELSEELYDLFNGEPDENGPVAERLDAAHEALEEIWSGTDDAFGDALFYLARAVRAAKKEA
jgi:transcriptional regulator with XRE-family HTH domain